MLKSVRDIGEYVIHDEKLGEEEIFVQKTKLKNTKKVIFVDFKENNGVLAYYGVHIEDYDPEKSNKYLYRIFNHRKFDLTPTAKIASIEKVKRRWELWFGEYSKGYRDNTLLKSLSDEFKENKEKIFEDISGKYGELNNKEKNNSILSIKIKNGKERYIGDFEIFREIFRKEVAKKFFTRKYNREIESKGEGNCYLCENYGEVYGFASPFSVFTVDKKGFAPQFLQKNSWKQLPICENCAVFSVAGREFLDKYLSKGFYGFRYYVIPCFVFGDIQNKVIEEIKGSERKRFAKSLLGLEDDLLDIIKEEKDIMNLIFVFYKPKQGDYFDIVKYVEDVPPSWIKKLFNTFDEVNRESVFREEYLKKLFGKNWAYDFIEGSWKGKKLEYMDLGGMIRTFFPSSKETGVYNKYFIDIIGDILAQKNINKDFLLNAFVREIRNEHINNKGFSELLLVLKSFYLLIFMDKLGLTKGGDKLEKENEKEKIGTTQRKRQMENFFMKFGNAFDSSDKRAVFLEGVLAKFLLDVQNSYYKGYSAPFRSKLYGLKLDKRKIRKLMPEIVEKLAQYKEAKDYPEYPWLKELLSEYLVDADNDGWNISKDEISYYFALGINLGKIFKEKKEEKNE